MSKIIECSELTMCTKSCENYGKPIPRNQGTPLCRLLIKYKTETNPVTRSSYEQIIKNRRERDDVTV